MLVANGASPAEQQSVMTQCLHREAAFEPRASFQFFFLSRGRYAVARRASRLSAKNVHTLNSREELPGRSREYFLTKELRLRKTLP